MPRYIDADKILDKMRNVMDMQDLYLPMHFIDLVIDEMPAADVREVMESVWIPVSERLPELDMTKPDECICLVWCDNEVGYGLGYYSNENIFSPNSIGEPHWICPRFSNVIAWCRLPEPYKSDEKTT